MKKNILLPLISTLWVPLTCVSPSHPRSSVSSTATQGDYWTQDHGRYKLTVPQPDGFSWFLEVEPAVGGRIASLKFGDQEVLHPGTGLLEGSTFWTSPQSAWGWPPPPEVDSLPYKAVLKEEHGQKILTLQASKPDPKTGALVGKTIRYDKNRRGIRIDYSIENKASDKRSFAFWEITRVPIGGLAFFPVESSFQGDSLLKPSREENSLAWLETGPESKDKMFRDGAESWLAHRYKDILFVKSMEKNVTRDQFAPKESEIEIYGNPSEGYIELEQQSPYQSFEPGEKKTWSVWWSLASLPQELRDAGLGSQKILEFTRKKILNMTPR